MDEHDVSRAQWRTSIYSSGNGQCVEVATNLRGIVAVRDSKDPDGAKLIFTAEKWSAFISSVKGGLIG